MIFIIAAEIFLCRFLLTEVKEGDMMAYQVLLIERRNYGQDRQFDFAGVFGET